MCLFLVVDPLGFANSYLCIPKVCEPTEKRRGTAASLVSDCSVCTCSYVSGYFNACDRSNPFLGCLDYFIHVIIKHT